MGEKRKKRSIEVLTKELDETIYTNMHDRILGRYCGEQAAKFDELVRSGVIVIDRNVEDWTSMFDNSDINWITT